MRPDDVVDFLSHLQDHGFVGCNVTLPHKQTAYAVAAEKSPPARRIIGQAGPITVVTAAMRSRSFPVDLKKSSSCCSRQLGDSTQAAGSGWRLPGPMLTITVRCRTAVRLP